MFKFKKIFYLLILTIMLTTPINIYAAGTILDEADLFTDSEESLLYEECSLFSEAYGVDMIVLTTNNNPYGNAEAYLADYINESTIGFVIDMENSEYAFDIGNAELLSKFTEPEMDEVEDKILDGLSDREFYTAANGFVTTAYELAGNNIDYIEPEDVSDFEAALCPGFGFAIIATAILTFIQLSKHKEKNIKLEAKDNVKQNSFNLNSKQDRFVRSYTTKTKKASSDSSSSSSSSSGSRSSGRSGKF